MKTLLIFLFGLLVLAGCKKDKAEDPKPKTPAETVAGLYAMTAFRYQDASDNVDLPTLPVTRNGVTASGTVEVTATAGVADKVALKLTFKVTGEQDFVIPIPELQVQAAGQGYTLGSGGTEVARVDGNTLEFRLAGTNQQGAVEVSCTARK